VIHSPYVEHLAQILVGHVILDSRLNMPHLLNTVSSVTNLCPAIFQVAKHYDD